jgi:hypothetical protein
MHGHWRRRRCDCAARHRRGLMVMVFAGGHISGGHLQSRRYTRRADSGKVKPADVVPY